MKKKNKLTFDYETIKHIIVIIISVLCGAWFTTFVIDTFRTYVVCGDVTKFALFMLPAAGACITLNVITIALEVVNVRES